jgi:hypothetical protein
MKKKERNTEINALKCILQQNQYQINNTLKRKLNKGNTMNNKNKAKGPQLHT